MSSVRPYERARKRRKSNSEQDNVGQLSVNCGNFRQSLQIDMKDLVGDAVGNMSISPASRDVVLAARRGLFIIDLEAPLEVPRFLPQGGTWDVADVQWNPHPSHAKYIVSTSSEKMLIWNLLLVGKTNIEHILKSHYRAITDINWHTTECDTVISTGVDSWLWAWDLREPHKPIFGLCAFNSGGTQVKWNRQNPNILASAHSNEVLIWDRRKGSLPLTTIHAHSSKIYGIDWSHSVPNELVTCSLDKTIKVWDINDSHEPNSTIATTYPVWRARNLPFGQGILSLPQRGETALELYPKLSSQAPLETFEGHTDVVKEFVWRKGGDDDDFQLITWSKDRTLRFWPVEPDTMLKVGHVHEPTRGRHPLPMDHPISFRNPPERIDSPPAFSAPVGHRSILAEVRAPPPPRHAVVGNIGKQGETMSKGNIGGKSSARMDAFTWLSNVKVGDRRAGSSSGPGSGSNSAEASRLRERSLLVEVRSASRGEEKLKEGEGAQSLQDEITSVLTKLASSKIKLEKHDLTKKRTCTLGLHGPWGESSSVFIRVIFTFPREYPTGTHPSGTPTVELERNPLISLRDRAYMQKRLRIIRERYRPCLEPCLNFLLFGDEGGGTGRLLLMDSESSSSDDDDDGGGDGGKVKVKEGTVSLLRNHKNLAEPRTSQGAFGPNGELVCFFRGPPRVVRNTLRGKFDTPDADDSSRARYTALEPSVQRYYQPPALLSDAVRRLSFAATDRAFKPSGRAESASVLRIMTNLMTVPPPLDVNSSIKRLNQMNQAQTQNRSVPLPRRSMVFLMSTLDIAGPDREVAAGYVFWDESLAGLCERNAGVARRCGRYDHERVFAMLRTLFAVNEKEKVKNGKELPSFAARSLGKKVVNQLYELFANAKDVQMLAMISIIVLQTSHGSPVHPKPHPKKPNVSQILISGLPKIGGMDYFSLAKSLNSGSPSSPTWPRLSSSPVAPQGPAPQAISTTSSRASWSSLFNTGSVRQFVAGVQDTFRDGLATPSEHQLHHSDPPLLGAIKQRKSGDSQKEKRKRTRTDSVVGVVSPTGSVSKHWNEAVQASSMVLPSLSVGHGRQSVASSSSFGLGSDGPGNFERRSVVFEPPPPLEKPKPIFSPELLDQFLMHVKAYAELLLRWQLYSKRIEMLKVVNFRDVARDKGLPYAIGLRRACKRCNAVLSDKAISCEACGNPFSKSNCIICRLPVKGLGRSCLLCCHITHISCWNSLDVPICPSGCGCFCSGFDGTQTRPSTRLGMTPQSVSAILPAYT